MSDKCLTLHMYVFFKLTNKESICHCVYHQNDVWLLIWLRLFVSLNPWQEVRRVNLYVKGMPTVLRDGESKERNWCADYRAVETIGHTHLTFCFPLMLIVSSKHTILSTRIYLKTNPTLSFLCAHVQMLKYVLVFWLDFYLKSKKEFFYGMTLFKYVFISQISQQYVTSKTIQHVLSVLYVFEYMISFF